jgi:hypothetical protein
MKAPPGLSEAGEWWQERLRPLFSIHSPLAELAWSRSLPPDSVKMTWWFV